MAEARAKTSTRLRVSNSILEPTSPPAAAHHTHYRDIVYFTGETPMHTLEASFTGTPMSCHTHKPPFTQNRERRIPVSMRDRVEYFSLD